MLCLLRWIGWQKLLTCTSCVTSDAEIIFYKTNRNQEKKPKIIDIHTETKVEMGQTHSKNERQLVDQTLHTVATKEREEIKRTTLQKMARRHNKEGGTHLEQESNRQRTIEDIDRGLHPVVYGQSLGERWNRKATDRGQWKTLMKGYIL